ncbi:14450_t:CDS:2 [Rhizophagus irregularis]|nr:14450_t:CDS:2 [Rhizophagus irregularis]
MIKSYNYDLEFKSEFEQAEVKREKLIETKMIGPEFAEKCHSEAIYISRPLSALISKCSSTYSYLFDFNYISAELELDIDNKSLSSQNLNSIALDSNYISEELELDIDTERLNELSTIAIRKIIVSAETFHELADKEEGINNLLQDVKENSQNHEAKH